MYISWCNCFFASRFFFCAEAKLSDLTCKGQWYFFFFFRCSVVIHSYTAGGFHAIALKKQGLAV